MNTVRIMVLTVTLAACGNAFAADDKNVSSVACRGYGYNTTDADLTFQNAGLYNPQTTYETVICPIVMDAEAGWKVNPNVDDADILVEFRVGSIATKAGCTLYKTTGSTTSAIGGETAPSNWAPNSVHTINFPNTAKVFVSDGVSLVCTIGPKVAITRVNVQEWGVTDEPHPAP